MSSPQRPGRPQKCQVYISPTITTTEKVYRAWETDDYLDALEAAREDDENVMQQLEAERDRLDRENRELRAQLNERDAQLTQAIDAMEAEEAANQRLGKGRDKLYRWWMTAKNSLTEAERLAQEVLGVLAEAIDDEYGTGEWLDRAVGLREAYLNQKEDTHE